MFLTEHFTVRSNTPETWLLVEPVVYRGRDQLLRVPAGFRTDFASVPRAFTWLIPRYGVYTRVAILHDYLCGPTSPVCRADADGIFRRALRELQVSLPRRWMMWAAVRANSWMSGANGREWAQFLLVALLVLPLLAAPVVLVQLWVWLFTMIEWAGRTRR